MNEEWEWSDGIKSWIASNGAHGGPGLVGITHGLVGCQLWFGDLGGKSVEVMYPIAPEEFGPPPAMAMVGDSIYLGALPDGWTRINPGRYFIKPGVAL